MYVTPGGEVVGDEYDGPKRKVADSRKEYRRLVALQGEERAGRIHLLRTQRRFKLKVNGVLVAVYVADFTYFRGRHLVVEDVKGKLTDLYRVKKRLMKACHGIDILET